MSGNNNQWIINGINMELMEYVFVRDIAPEKILN